MKRTNNRIVFLLLVMCMGCSMKPSEEPAKNIYAYFMYALGEDPNNKVQCSAEFKKGNEEGDHISLEKSAKVFIDTAELTYDDLKHFSSYGTERDPSTFMGKHTWVVQLPAGNRISYDFEVVPFVITSAIPDTVGYSCLAVCRRKVQIIW